MTRCLASPRLYVLSLSVREAREARRWEELKQRDKTVGKGDVREHEGERGEGKVKRQGDEREKEA